jgi:hypothetical protein
MVWRRAGDLLPMHRQRCGVETLGSGEAGEIKIYFNPRVQSPHRSKRQKAKASLAKSKIITKASSKRILKTPHTSKQNQPQYRQTLPE